jgi:hypothetical protein
MKIIKGFIVILSLLVLTIVTLSSFRSKDLLVKIYRSYYGQDIYSTFGILPQDFKDNLLIDTTDFQREKYSLIKMKYLKSTINSWYHVISFGGDAVFIKAHPYSLVGVSDTTFIDTSNGTAKLINLEAFNRYCKLVGIKTKQEVLLQFAYFLSDEQDYKIVKGKSDLEQLLANYEWKLGLPNIFGERLIQIQNLNLSQDLFYVWYEGRGLIQFEFEFSDELNVTNVRSMKLGFLGIEDPYCC